MTRAPTAAFRPDIEGLRAVAVVMVLVYHAFPSALAGGFFGVDVFFVISGYLITQLVIRELSQGTFRLRDFYARRVRRLVPALLAVLLLCCVAGWLLMTPVEFVSLGQSTAWSAPFLANVFLTASGDYFTDTSFPSPLLHLWSLGVEEQFYILWPLLLILAARQGVTRRVLIAVIATSLAISLWGAWDSPTPHFYRLTCRAWELAAGGLLGLHDLSRPDREVSPGNFRSLAGLGLLLAGAVFLNSDRAFPRGWSLIPVGGAVLLIAAGSASWVNRYFLSASPVRFVGRISYSLYLWHWPCLAFTNLVLGSAAPPGPAAAALGLAFAMACASYYLVESPLRFGRIAQHAVPGLLIGLAGFTLLGRTIDAGRIPSRLTGPAIEAFDTARFDWTFPGDFNSGKTAGFRPWRLPGHRPQTVLFIGDSHIQQYWSRVAYVIRANPDSARSAEFATYTACPPLPGVNTLRRGWSCDRFLEHAMQEAERADVDTVVFGAFWEQYLLGEFLSDHRPQSTYRADDPLRTVLDLDSPDTQRALDRFQELLARLVAGGRRVFIVLSNPTSPRFLPSFLLPPAARWTLRSPDTILVDPEKRSVDPAAFEAFVAPLTQRLREIAARAGAKALNPRDTLCEATLCATVDAQGIPLYRDSNHLRPSFAQERATFLDEVLLGRSDHANSALATASTKRTFQP